MYNPVKYTDPSGHLSDEQIMKYVNLAVWNIYELDVLKEDYSELYNFLSALQFGDELIAYTQSGSISCGVASLDDNGNLVFINGEETNYLGQIFTTYGLSIERSSYSENLLGFSLDRRIGNKTREVYYGNAIDFSSAVYQPNKVNYHEVGYLEHLAYGVSGEAASELLPLGFFIDIFDFLSLGATTPGRSFGDEITTIEYTDLAGQLWIQELIVRDGTILQNRTEPLQSYITRKSQIWNHIH
jgi:hypothetical protein